ncbi:MAG: homoserine dehydrogenase [Lysobacteraceae bacterium]
MSAGIGSLRPLLADAALRLPFAAPDSPRLLLLGCGGVGRAFLQRLHQLGEPIPLLGVANSRRALLDPNGINPSLAGEAIERALPRPPTSALIELLRHGDIVVDATASAELAAQHPAWLGKGLNVVTANKLGRGGPLARNRAIGEACLQRGVGYGDAATVGAGLPFLRTLRALRDGGDRILSLGGLLSGTLAWLLDGYDGRLPFSERVEQAKRAGITEPDPRNDLSGEDVKRKLLILLRSVGFELEPEAVNLRPLLGETESIAVLDRRLGEAATCAAGRNGVLRYVARFDSHRGARVGLEILDRDDPLASSGSHNTLQIRSCRYDQQSLLLQGPGAGTAITAAALLDDVRALTRHQR